MPSVSKMEIRIRARRSADSLTDNDASCGGGGGFAGVLYFLTHADVSFDAATASVSEEVIPCHPANDNAVYVAELPGTKLGISIWKRC